MIVFDLLSLLIFIRVSSGVNGSVQITAGQITPFNSPSKRKMANANATSDHTYVRPVDTA